MVIPFLERGALFPSPHDVVEPHPSWFFILPHIKKFTLPGHNGVSSWVESG